MISRSPVTPLLVSLVLMGCSYRERGRFAAVTAQRPTFATVLSPAPASGRACFGAGAELGDDHIIDAAVRDALSRAPGADAIVDALIVDEGTCIRVTGTPARVSAP